MYAPLLTVKMTPLLGSRRSLLEKQLVMVWENVEINMGMYSLCIVDSRYCFTDLISSSSVCNLLVQAMNWCRGLYKATTNCTSCLMGMGKALLGSPNLGSNFNCSLAASILVRSSSVNIAQKSSSSLSSSSLDMQLSKFQSMSSISVRLGF